MNEWILDNTAAGLTNTISVSTTNTIEAVQIKVNVAHLFIGDIAIELTSPAGTKSILMNPMNNGGSGDHYINFELTSNAFYGESMNGNWTARFVDVEAGSQGYLANWSIRFFGH